jgi:hypothetical protein
MIPNETIEKAYTEIDLFLVNLERGLGEIAIYQGTNRWAEEMAIYQSTNRFNHSHIRSEILKAYDLIKDIPAQNALSVTDNLLTTNGIRVLIAGGIREYIIDTDPEIVFREGYPVVVSVTKDGLYISKHLINSPSEYAGLTEHYENEDVHFRIRTSRRLNGQIFMQPEKPALSSPHSSPPQRAVEGKKSRRAKVPLKTKLLLQKEIGSICPFCPNEEVNHFETHHIDENPANNEFDNLLMLCRICHSKITSGEITSEEVRKKKDALLSKLTKPLSSAFNSIFGYQYEAHKKNVIELNAGISEAMKNEADNLAKECGERYSEAKGFFELLYRILHLRHKGKYGIRDFKNVRHFFYDYDWKIGHYLNSFISIVKLVDDNLAQTENGKNYVGILQNSTNNDELRLVYYYLISREKPEKGELISLFSKYSFFKNLERSSLPLIYPEDLAEYALLQVEK